MSVLLQQQQGSGANYEKPSVTAGRNGVLTSEDMGGEPAAAGSVEQQWQLSQVESNDEWDNTLGTGSAGKSWDLGDGTGGSPVGAAQLWRGSAGYAQGCQAPGNQDRGEEARGGKGEEGAEKETPYQAYFLGHEQPVNPTDSRQHENARRPGDVPAVTCSPAWVQAAQMKLELEAQIQIAQLKNKPNRLPRAAGNPPTAKKRIAKKTAAKKPRAAAKDSPRPFKCEFEGCEYAATQRRYIIEHTRVHTGVRPYKCSWEGCKYASSGSGHMARHVRTHTGDRPYACKEPDCGYFASQVRFQ